MKEYYQSVSKTLILNLRKRQIEGFYCETKKEAVTLVQQIIPKQSKVGWGGSVTLNELKIVEALRNDCQLIDRAQYATKEEKKQKDTELFNSDYFLMSTNAITLEGELINLDGMGSRVSFLIYGPEQVILFVGMNKIVSDLESGIRRVRDIAAPKNTQRLKKQTPCIKTGKCEDCFSKDSICSQLVITRRSSIPNRIKVILIGETLGY